jgi:LuxR family maltose regulon positive regulatory protein
MYLETAENLAPERSVLMGEVAAAQAFLARTMGNEQRLVRYSEQALALIPKTDLSARSIVAMNLGIAYWHNGDMEKTEQTLSEILSGTQQSGNKYAELTSLFFLGRVHAVRGHLRQAIDIFKNIVALKVRMPIIGLVYLDLSALHYELNDLEACEKYLELGEDLIGTKEHLEFQIAGMMQKARLMVAKGDYPGALSILESCSQISNSADIPLRTQHRIASCIVELAIACEDVEQALAWSAKASEGADAHPFYRFLSLSTVRLLMAKGEKSEALERINEWKQTAEVAGWDYGMVHLCLLKALASPDMDSAIHPMTGALSTGQPEGFIRTFIDLGSDLVPILREAARRGVQPEYVGKILAAYGEQPGQTALPPEIEPLSDREMEVLRLLAAGLTNKQIADQLFVSISTVKSHVHHISSKLDVSNRTQAVARARQLNLL